MEIGGYIELDRYTLPMLHEGAVALNCGTNALAYLIRARGIKKLLLPRFLCSSVHDVCRREHVACRYYSVTEHFLPSEIKPEDGEWLYLVNYYGQLSEEKVLAYHRKYPRLIIDNIQAYFQAPVPGVDTIYSCRKFFGVPDGAFLYTDAQLDEELPQDESFQRMRFVLGRFERTASEFYREYAANNELFADEPIKRMSKLTDNLLRGIDYDAVRKRREKNFAVLYEVFGGINRLELIVPDGPFMYPLYIENGAEIRKELQAEKIYIPTLWPDIFDFCNEDEPEYDMAKNILPLPVDQRYGAAEMDYLAKQIKERMEQE